MIDDRNFRLAPRRPGGNDLHLDSNFGVAQRVQTLRQTRRFRSLRRRRRRSDGRFADRLLKIVQRLGLNLDRRQFLRDVQQNFVAFRHFSREKRRELSVGRERLPPIDPRLLQLINERRDLSQTRTKTIAQKDEILNVIERFEIGDHRSSDLKRNMNDVLSTSFYYLSLSLIKKIFSLFEFILRDRNIEENVFLFTEIAG